MKEKEYLIFGEIKEIKENNLLISKRLVDIAKSCYVLSRYCLISSTFEMWTPAFILMQQALENYFKGCLKISNINWQKGNHGHLLTELLKLSLPIKFIKEKIYKREDLTQFLSELEIGYTINKYGESMLGSKKFKTMLDLFDEIIFILNEGFTDMWENKNKKFKNNEERNRFISLPIQDEIYRVTIQHLKQPFIFSGIFPNFLHLDFKKYINKLSSK